MGCHFLLQGIFPTQGLNPGLQHCRLILYQPSHKGKAVAKRLECLPTTAGPAACGDNFDAKPTRPQHQRAFPQPDKTFLEPKIEPQGPLWTCQVSLNKAHALSGLHDPWCLAMLSEPVSCRTLKSHGTACRCQLGSFAQLATALRGAETVGPSGRGQGAGLGHH